jgi:hypothetical protein
MDKITKQPGISICYHDFPANGNSTIESGTCVNFLSVRRALQRKDRARMVAARDAGDQINSAVKCHLGTIRPQ